MALEMLASRWLAPAFGASLTTWSVLIAVTLLAGSLGAWWGGWRAARGRTALAVPLVVAGSWTALLACAAPAFVEFALPLAILPGLVLCALVMVWLPAFLLGGVLPALASRAAGALDPGTLLGRLVAASTLGSLLGTLLSALWFIPALGLFRTALGVAACLLFAGGAELRGLRRAACLLPIVCALAVGGADRAPDTWETAHGRLAFVRRGAGWQLDVNGITQARGGVDTGMPGSLLRGRTYTELLPWMRPLASRALVVGLGGGITGRMLARHGVEVDTYELDARLVEVVRRELGVAGPVFVGDGRALWRRTQEHYDVIVLDAFHGERVPPHLFTREAFGELRVRLASGGVLCIHTILPLRHRITQALLRTLASVFPRVRIVRSAPGDGLQDLYFFASVAPLEVPPHPDLRAAGWLGNEFVALARTPGVIFTDERSTLAIWHREIAAAHRRRARP
jgi:predicted membrane-bound spermidine synthase